MLRVENVTWVPGPRCLKVGVRNCSLNSQASEDDERFWEADTLKKPDCSLKCWNGEHVTLLWTEIIISNFWMLLPFIFQLNNDPIFENWKCIQWFLKNTVCVCVCILLKFFLVLYCNCFDFRLQFYHCWRWPVADWLDYTLTTISLLSYISVGTVSQLFTCHRPDNQVWHNR